MDQVEDDIAITKYLGTSSTKFLEAANESAKLNDASQYLNGPPELGLN